MTIVQHTPTGFPFIQVFYNGTGSKAGATVMASLVVGLLLCAVIGFLATASRMTWSFARDRGMPFHHFISKASWLHPHLHCTALLNSHSDRAKNFDSHDRHSHGNDSPLPTRAHLHRFHHCLRGRRLPIYIRSVLLLPNPLLSTTLAAHHRTN